MKLYEYLNKAGDHCTYYWAESVEEVLAMIRERLDGEELDGSLYEITIEKGKAGFIDWYEPEEPFKKATKIDLPTYDSNA